MLLILLAWIYILSISIIIGVSMNNFFGLKNQDFIITLFFGFFGVTLLSGFWAIPFAIDIKFHIALLIIAIFLGFISRSQIVRSLNQIKSEIQELTIFIKSLLCIIGVMILAQCASPPFLIDNESYYIQTIKWLNEYGFVNGLVNLHIFLGQTSGWHILQSAFNFSFLYDRFNDISGLALLLGNVYALIKLNTFITKKETSKLNLVIGLFPLWNTFFFQFVSAPSPDVAIYVLTFILLHQFILCYSSYSQKGFIAVVLFSLFIAFIKLTGLVFCLLPIILYKRNYIFTRKTTKIVLLFGSLTGLLFVIKNLIITGNLLFPLQGIESLKTSWSLPPSIETYFANYMQPYAYHLDSDAYKTASILLRLKTWLFAPLPHGLFNMLMMGLIAIMPILIKKFFDTKAIWIIFGIAILNLLLLFLSSPQYRFFFPFILVFCLLIASLLLIHKNSIKVSLVFCTVLAAIPLFFKVNNKQLTSNKHHEVTSQFSLDYFVQPFKNSKYPEDYNSIQLNKTSINSPTQIDFFWGTGNIPLPAVNQEQLDYFKTNFRVIPQQRTNNLKDGFQALELK
jgi:hypothetical protein